MDRKFVLSCESTIDLPFSYVNRRDIGVIFYSYQLAGTEYVDDMQRNPEALPNFYRLLNAGNLTTTSQLNAYAYEAYFEEQLQRGDVLYITLGTGMTKSYQNALLAAETMREKYPDRKIPVVDSLCSSSGYGMLVDDAAECPALQP